MDDTHQPHDDQPEPNTELDRWMNEKRDELTKRVIDSGFLFRVFGVWRRFGAQLRTDEATGNPSPMRVEDMLTIGIAHVYYQALIDAYPQIAQEAADLTWEEAMHLLYVREHAT